MTGNMRPLTPVRMIGSTVSQETTQNKAPAGSSTRSAASHNRHSALPCTGRSVRALGAIRSGRLWTATDDYGQRTLLFRTVWTAADGYGRAASIYGSEGWGFEFLRACQQGLYGKGLVA